MAPLSVFVLSNYITFNSASELESHHASWALANARRGGVSNRFPAKPRDVALADGYIVEKSRL